jgi:DNA-binding response OmpR family regulator
MQRTILLVEDELEAATGFTEAVTDLGCTVWHAESTADARTVLRGARPDLIALDLTLPDVDGLVLASTLRNEAPGVPFMVCSVGTTAEKVLAFKLGAEDFVAKPYEAPELQVRVEAILARHAPPAPRPRLDTEVEGPDLGRLRVDLTRWRVTIDDKPLSLTPTEFQLLVFMAARPGAIISREELARGVWGNESMSRSRTIDAYVRRISTKLSETPRQDEADWPPRILHIRGLGYQLAVPRAPAA